MTDTEILELVIKHFGEEWCEEDGDGWVEFSGRPSAFLKFAQELRKQTIKEILTSLEEVPNPEANRTAINRIMSKYYD